MTSAETFEQLTVGSVMHVGVIECEPETPLAEVARLMAEEHTHSVVVCGLAAVSRDGRAWALLSDVDLMRAFAADGASGVAFQAAASEIVTIGVHEPLARAAQVMGEHGCSHLVATAADSGLPAGVVSSLDVIRGLAWGWRPTARAVD